MTENADLADLPLMSRTKQLQRRFGQGPQKSRGQHFLVDGNIAAKIADAALRHDPDRIIEIGAGLGALTVPLAKSAIPVIAWESDRKLAEPLKAVVGDMDNVQLQFQDFLKADLHGLTGPDTVAVGNLPYFAATRIIQKLLEVCDDPFRAIVVTVQREVANRILAIGGARQSGSLTMYCQYYIESIDEVCDMKPDVFMPPPEVNSTALAMVPRRRPPEEIADADDFFTVVRGAFAYRRKTLRNALNMAPKTDLDRSDAMHILYNAGINSDRRAESLSFDEFVRLGNALTERKESA